jgi:large subunit ribosomal protein L21
MFAIVEIGGHQFKVSKDQKIYVDRLQGDPGSEVVIDKVLLLEDNGSTKVGLPTVSGVSVKATIDSHLKGEKVLIFKKKRRKGYAKKNGHRQYLTSLVINSIEA